MSKIKEYLNYVFGLVVLILSALLFRKSRKNEELQSELNRERVNNDIKQNEEDRLAAKSHADALVDEYEKLRGDDR